MAGENTFNIGRDGAQLTIIDSNSGPVTISNITGFSSKPEMIKLKSVPVNGRVLRRSIYDGHSGTFEIDRQDASYDQYFADAEAAYFAGLPPGQVFITQTVNELDGSVSQWQYSDVALYPEDNGNWRGQEKVVQKFSFEAGRKIRIA
ncbi:hypothetical protein F4827_003088 [Paraburkholderia bannensis]|uniref:Phage tail protein n=1 Tax=Paraburkholderia bannensis TaxID=765414 RepID=A0A7W9TXH0_9BURK|nr:MULTISPECIES: hypothetical protein [Paraburkholderia]MBB3258220.1 hypothetical protein [Paraburkholderia sp. WP4_3_2]MBB6103233.1 hypothetical protein [Paraburkholderia bannensis]